MTETPQTNTLGPAENPPKRRRGGQPGNRNAQKPVNALSARVRALKARARRAIVAALRQGAPTGERSG